MASPLKIVLIGVAAYLVWDKFLKGQDIFGTAGATGTGAPNTVPGTAKDTPTISNATQISVQMMANHAANDGGGLLRSYDQWNYLYNVVRGGYAPNWELVVKDKPRTYNMTLEEFWGYVLKYRPGFSGLGGVSGLPALFTGDNWPANSRGRERAYNLNAWERAVRLPVY